MKIGLDVVKKALHAARHPGIGSNSSLLSLARQGLPYLTSITGRARAPITIYWNVNSVCNLHCKMCDVGTFNEDSNFFKNLRIDRKLHEISLEKFCSVVDEVATYRPVMAINGTEPLMYKPLGHATAYARSKGLEVAVTTGAYNLPQRADELADAGLTRLNVSIDGPPELHNQIRGRADVFERAADGIRRFYEGGIRNRYSPEILINFTITNLNYAWIMECYKAIRELPVSQINFVLMNFVTEPMASVHNAKWGDKYPATINCLNDDVQPSLIDVHVLDGQLSDLKNLQDQRIVFLFESEKPKLEKYFQSPNQFMGHVPCMSSWFIAQIMADGEVIPYTRCYHVPLGNINSEPFLSIWNGEKARAWRRELRNVGRFPACSRCDMVC